MHKKHTLQQPTSTHSSGCYSHQCCCIDHVGTNDLVMAVAPECSGPESSAAVSQVKNYISSCISIAVKMLLDKGEQNIIIANLYPAQITPSAAQSDIFRSLQAASGPINIAIKQATSALAAVNPNAMILMYDTMTVIQQLHTSSKQIGFKFVDQPCLSFDQHLQQCTDPSQHFFW